MTITHNYSAIIQGWNSDVKPKEPRLSIYKNEEEFETFVNLNNNSKELHKWFNDKNEDLEIASKNG